jgi:DNA topoisomerase-6 subunit B
VVLLIHVASTNVPFTSESKDAIADIPEIKDEIELAVKEVSRKLSRYLSKQDTLKKRREKEIIITKVLPKMAQKLAQTLKRETPDIGPVVAKVMGNLLVHRVVESDGNGGVNVAIKVKNFSAKKYDFKVHDMLPFNIEGPVPQPKVITMGNDYDYIWDVSISAGASKVIQYSVATLSDSEVSKLPVLIVEGLDEELVTGSKAIRGVN